MAEAWADAPWQPRRWQAEALPAIIDAVRSGSRTVVSAVTGSGKSILIAELCAVAARRLGGGRTVVIGAPTQALVEQLYGTMQARGLDVGRYYGRVKEPDHDVIVTCYPSVMALTVALAELRRRTALLIADEVHRTQGEQIRAAIEVLSPASAIGFSATPYRADDKETLELWSSVAYQYTLGAAWRDGVLVPFTAIPWGGQGDAEDVDGIVLGMIREHAPPGPGIVSALSIDDAEGYAAYLVEHGVPAEAIHSRLSPADQADRLERLLSGELRCLVHVAMLQEGVDIPALRWLALRRPVGSRVRFVQEVGRGLRVIAEPDQWGEKSRCVLLDPHDLFGALGISYPAALGEPEACAVTARDVAEIDEVEFAGAVMPAARAVDAVSAWARQLLLVLQAEGIAAESKYAVDDDVGTWRRRRASSAQIGALGRMRWAARYMPPEHRDQVRWACDHADRLRRGAASDLMSTLVAVADASAADRKRRRHWPWPSAVQVPALEIGDAR